jgi:class 3 adenylate cyclase
MNLAGTCPLPEHPGLAEVAAALNASRTWGLVLDREWRLVYMTDDIRLSNGENRELVPVPLGGFYLGPEVLDVMLGWTGRVWSIDAFRACMRALGPWLLTDAAEWREPLRELLDPRLRDDLGGIDAHDGPAALTYVLPGARSAGAPADVLCTTVRLRETSGALMGLAFIMKPAVGMAVLGVAALGDSRHFERVQQLAKARRRPAAILFADLDGSSPLSRRLSTAAYFNLGRRLVRAADRCVVDAGGMVGRHVGDGVVAFFLAEHAGTESAAARACIEAMRALRAATNGVAVRSGLQPEDVVLRFGLHWGATLHVGQITTVARSEVDALGDEMNETARVEACASGGRALASKALVERLEPADAAALGLDPNRLTYTALADLTTATEKARRDAPAIAVCEV